MAQIKSVMIEQIWAFTFLVPCNSENLLHVSVKCLRSYKKEGMKSCFRAQELIQPTFCQSPFHGSKHGFLQWVTHQCPIIQLHQGMTCGNDPMSLNWNVWHGDYFFPLSTIRSKGHAQTIGSQLNKTNSSYDQETQTRKLWVSQGTPNNSKQLCFP